MRKREDINVVSTAAQVLHEYLIVEIAAGNLVQMAVDDEPDVHGAGVSQLRRWTRKRDAAYTLSAMRIPSLGLGTWDLRGRVVRDALELGYRHVETAQMYENEPDAGRGLAAARVDREDVFVTTVNLLEK